MCSTMGLFVVVVVSAGVGVSSVRLRPINRECWKITLKGTSNIDGEGTYLPVSTNLIVVL